MKHLFPDLFHRFPILTIAISSFALSLWAIIQDPLLNTDGILYLVAAEVFLNEGLTASLSIYGWPFLQILIASLHWATSLPLTACGNIVLGLGFVLLIHGFCRLVDDFGGTRQTRWIAFVLVLLLPTINDFRSALVRDPLYMAFLLLALSEQIRYIQRPGWGAALRWGIYATTALLFRVEALAIILAGPTMVLFCGPIPFLERLRIAARLYVVPAVLGLAAIAYLAGAHPADMVKFKLATDFNFLISGFEQSTSGFARQKEAIASRVLNPNSAEDATLFYVAGILAITLLNLIRAITWPYLIILMGGASHCRWPTLDIKTRALLWYALITAGYTTFFALAAGFSLTRYCLPLALMLLIALPFTVQSLWRNGNGIVKAAVVFLVVFNGADTLVSSAYKKAYVREVSLWLHARDSIAPGTLISNEPYIAYFSDKSSRDNILRAINVSHQPLTDVEHTHWVAGRTYAQRVSKGETEILLRDDINRGGGKIIAFFEGGDARSVYIFSVAETVPRSPELEDLQTP